MKRKFLSILMVLVLVFSVTCVSAQAETTCDALSAAKLYLMVATANHQIDVAVACAQITPYNDVPWLLRTVDRITSKVFAYADSIGAVVRCEYEVYYIDGQYVKIDPLHVVYV